MTRLSLGRHTARKTFTPVKLPKKREAEPEKSSDEGEDQGMEDSDEL